MDNKFNEPFKKYWVDELEKSYYTNSMNGIFEKITEMKKNLFLTSAFCISVENRFYKKYYRLVSIRKVVYKWKSICRDKSPAKNITFLDLNSINSLDSKHTLVVADPNSLSKWIFSIKELIRIIYTDITYSSDEFPGPQYPRNPYTNNKFTKGQLSYIYKKITTNGYKIPLLIHKFKKNNFSIKKFTKNNFKKTY